MPRQLDLAKRQAWRRRLLEFERGDTTITQFCRRQGVRVWAFYYWRRKLQPPHGRQGNGRSSPIQGARSHHRSSGSVDPSRRFVDGLRQSGTNPRLRFVPIEITGGASVEVYLPNGARVAIPCHDRGAINAVIAALLSNSQEAPRC